MIYLMRHGETVWNAEQRLQGLARISGISKQLTSRTRRKVDMFYQLPFGGPAIAKWACQAPSDRIPADGTKVAQ